MNTHVLQGGFDAPPQDGARAFRSIMNALARPGRIFETAGAIPPPMSVACGTVILTPAIQPCSPAHAIVKTFVIGSPSTLVRPLSVQVRPNLC